MYIGGEGTSVGRNWLGQHVGVQSCGRLSAIGDYITSRSLLAPSKDLT